MPGSIPGFMSQINKHACKTVCVFKVGENNLEKYVLN